MGDTLAQTVHELREELSAEAPRAAQPVRLKLLRTLVDLGAAQVQLEDKGYGEGIHSLCLLERELDTLAASVNEELQRVG